MIERVIQDVLARLPGSEYRPQQIEMARLVESSIASGRHALIEAGTGSGKSFGYLLPVLESGKKAVISTGTIALQEQLLNKDIPFLQEFYRPELSFAIAKGRSNYVCLRKLWEADQRVGPFDPVRVRDHAARHLAAMAGEAVHHPTTVPIVDILQGRFPWAARRLSEPVTREGHLAALVGR